MLVLTRKMREQIQIGDHVVITILHVKGQTVRIGIEAPREVRVLRAELPKNEPVDPKATNPADPTPGAKCPANKPLALASRTGARLLRRTHPGEHTGNKRAPKWQAACCSPIADHPLMVPFIAAPRDATPST